MLLSPDGTLVVLSELEPVLSRRFFATQRAAGGGLCIFATALSTALLPNEAAIIAALAAAGKAAQYAQLTVTLLPSAPELVAYHPTSAAAALALTRGGPLLEQARLVAPWR